MTDDLSAGDPPKEWAYPPISDSAATAQAPSQPVGTGPVGTGPVGTGPADGGLLWPGRSHSAEPVAGAATQPTDPAGADRPDSAGGGRGRRRVRVLAGAVIVALVGAGVFAFAMNADGCSGDDAVTVKVSVAPEIEPAVAKAAGRFNDARREIGGKGGKCVKAVVTNADPAQLTTLLGHGTAIGATSRPDVWIPDSTLWISLLRSMTPGRQVVEVTETSVAQSLLVIGMPRTLADELRSQGVTADHPSWKSLLRAGSGLAGDAVGNDQAIPPNLVKLQVPDPARNAAGLGSLTILHQLWDGDPDQRTKFTGSVRTLRENTVPDVTAGLAAFERDEQDRYPIIIAPEQAVFAYNQSNPANPALAVYPPEGTLSMDYPYTITTDDTEKVKAARMLAAAMRTAETAEDVRAMGFRSTDGTAPTAFGPQSGVSQRPVSAPQPADTQKAIEVWYKLSKGIRNVTLIDISSSTNDKVAAELTRLQATALATEEVLALMSDDTEIGLWLFATHLRGSDDWQELVSVGPLSGRLGQGTRRQQMLFDLTKLEAKPGLGPGLYDSVLAAFRMMKRTYNPEMVNSILVFTNGSNEDANGTSLPDLLTALHNEYDPARPVQIIMIDYGDGVAREVLQQIAEATRGKVYFVQTPQQIQEVVLDAISRRACANDPC